MHSVVVGALVRDRQVLLVHDGLGWFPVEQLAGPTLAHAGHPALLAGLVRT